MRVSSLVLIALTVAPLSCNRPRATPSAGSSAAGVTSAPTIAPLEAELHLLPLQAELHLPPLVAGQSAPLLIMLHGLGASAQDIEKGSDWLDFSRQHGIAWLAPSGTFDKQGRRFWNAGPSCCNFDRLAVDHVAQLAALIERTVANPRIDRARVFVGGHSNGAFMAHRLACERPDLVRGVIALSGTGPLDPAACKPPGALRVLQVHGDADPIVPYAGGHLFQNPRLPQHLSAAETTRNWASLLGCNPTPATTAPIDLEASLAGAETRVQSYSECKTGQVALWTVTRGSHLVGFRAPAPAAIWAFISQ